THGPDTYVSATAPSRRRKRAVGVGWRTALLLLSVLSAEAAAAPCSSCHKEQARALAKSVKGDGLQSPLFKILEERARAEGHGEDCRRCHMDMASADE